MTTERDELFQLILGRTTTKAVERIMAAGYRRPQPITTSEELDALPVGSVVILRDAKHEPHPAQKGEHGWRLPFVDDFWTSEEILSGSTASAELVPQ